MSIGAISSNLRVANLDNSETDSITASVSDKTVSTKASLLFALPQVLIQKISVFLSPCELGRSIRLCSLWKKAIEQNVVWNFQTHRLGLNIRPQLRQVLTGYRSNQVIDCTFNAHLLHTIAQYDDFKMENAKQQFINPHPLMAFGKQEWLTLLGGDSGEEPALPSNIHEISQSECPFWPGKVVEETHMLVLIPKEVATIEYKRSHALGGRLIVKGAITRPLNLESLNTLFKTSMNGDGIGCYYLSSEIARKSVEAPVKQSHWVLMTKDILPGSKKGTVAAHKSLVEQSGYELPDELDAAAATLLEYRRSGKRLFPSVYMHCQGSTRGFQHMVGYFAPTGLDIDYDELNINLVGAVALKRFFKKGLCES